MAGDALRVSGSDVAAAQDINLLGKSVTIDEGRDTSQSKLVTKMEQDAFSLSIGGSVINAIQTMQDMGEAAGKTKNTRVKALAAATAAMAAANAAKDIAQNGANVSISLTYGHSEKEETRTQTSSDAIGSTVAAGNNLTIVATGAGKGSNIRVVGSDLAAGNNVTLAADNRIDLLAAQDLEEQHSKSKSMNASAGIAASVGTNGTAFGVTASVGLGRGQEDGSGITQRNTHVNAGNVLTIASGGDTTLKGATAAGRQVVADIGGDLNIESLQDTAKFASKNESLNVSGTVGFGASVSASYNKSKINSDYASVQEQSGIAAGDGGFDIRVKGNTDLKGGVIASTHAAIEQDRNSLVTGTLTQSDLANHATYKASGFGVSGGFSVGGGDGKDPKANGEGKGLGGSNLMNVASSSSARMNMPVAMFDSGSDSSVTKSGISAGSIIITDEAGQQQKAGRTVEETVAAINRNVATGMDTSGRIANNFDKESVEASFKVVGAFAKEVGTYLSLSVAEADAKKKAAENPNLDLSFEQRRQLLAEAKQIEDNWGPGGTYRQIATVLVAAASGTVVTAIGKEALSAAADEMRQLMIADSQKFAGVTDGSTTLSNVSGPSNGVKGDGFKIGGVRVDLDVVCGADNRRCETNADGSLKLNELGQVQFNPKAAGNQSLGAFMQSSEAQKMVGPTGGIQGAKGTLFGVPYEPGSWHDKLIEAFSGTHDMIGGKLGGLYDEQGNIKRGQSTAEKILHDRWSEVAIPVSAPFAAAELLSPEVWQAMAVILKAAK